MVVLPRQDPLLNGRYLTETRLENSDCLFFLKNTKHHYPAHCPQI